MDVEESQAAPSEDVPNLFAAKRPASEELETASSAKRIKTSNDDDSMETDARPQDTVARIPFPDKVGLTNAWMDELMP